ncbi:hypothetical protein ACFV9D_19255 [Streptomyces sp. NPDC059875]|uniref:effector-associated constant component EACC1 n=1 Tax=unclassified Streptomyces TaxID=2593676 RepID=UPI003646F6D7
MDIAVIAEGPDGGDRLRSLHEWLADVEELRGRVDGRERPPEAGTLGPVLEALTVALGPAGAATAFATGLVAWLRTRRGDVHIKVTVPDRGSVELTAKRVAELDADTLRQQVADVIDLVDRREDGSEPRELP